MRKLLAGILVLALGLGLSSTSLAAKKKDAGKKDGQASYQEMAKKDKREKPVKKDKKKRSKKKEEKRNPLNQSW